MWTEVFHHGGHDGHGGQCSNVRDTSRSIQSLKTIDSLRQQQQLHHGEEEGDHGKDQVENIHRILSKARVKSRPSVLWCYKKELGFSTHRKKRIQEIKKAQSRGLYDPDKDDPFDLFISSTNIRWTYYKETDKVLGQTFGMCVLQDFEAITPNLLARTIETVEGGGIIVILIKTVKSLKQLYTLSMDVHSRFRTESHHEVIPRFNERFILSLGDCAGCLVLDDELNILPISSNINYLPAYDGEGAGLGEGDADLSGYYNDPELTELKASLVNTPHVGNLVALTKTLDQAKAVMSFLDAVSDKSLRSTVALTAARGRGKSAAIGLCLAGAIAFGYSNVFVTAPSPENLKTCFEFVIEGLKALNYAEHLDFEALYEHVGELGKVVVRINIFRNHRQTIQYILPSDSQKLAQAELVAIDEAAAIPLSLVKKLMGPYLVFLSSTINGYEGTGRSLSLKLIQQLRVQQGAAITSAANAAAASVTGSKGKKGERRVHEDRWKTAADSFMKNSSEATRTLTEITLQVPIRYSANDPIEKWMNSLLCLDNLSHAFRIVSNIPSPKDCELFLVDRDALFSYHPLAESLLQRIWSLYTSAHYKNSPNDLQILSDAPAHRLFVLLGPQRPPSSSGKSQMPDVLCIVQVAFEGRISQKSVQTELSKGNKASGDMIPWTISQQFNDSEFATLSGARIVRIATHPDVQKMGYGSRAVEMLISYFQGELTVQTISPSLQAFGGEGAGNAFSEEAVHRSEAELGQTILQNEDIKPRTKLPPLLTPIHDRPAERLHWLGVSFGLTSELLSFWSRKSFKVCYLRQTSNDLTGEHSCIVLKELDCSNLAEEGTPQSNWLSGFVQDYRSRLVSLLSFSFRHLESSLSLTLLDPDRELTAALNEADDAQEGATETTSRSVSAKELLSVHMTHHDFKRLEMYSRNLVDHHMILDLVPRLAALFFQGRLGAMRLSLLQAAIFLAIGLQHREVDDVSRELDLPANQVLAFFNKTVRKLTSHFRRFMEKEEERAITTGSAEGSSGRIERRFSSSLLLGAGQEAENEEQEDEVRREQKKLILAHGDLTKHKVKLSTEQIKATVGKNPLAVPKTISVPKPVASNNSAPQEADRKESQEKDKKHKKKRDREQEQQPLQVESVDGAGEEEDEQQVERGEKKKHKKQKKSKEL